MRTYFPVFVKDIFHRGPETYGNLLALMGLGSILRLAGHRQRGQHKKERDTSPSAALVCLGAGISGFALSKSLPVSEAFLVLVGASMMAVFATVNSLVQLITTNEMRGRVMSVYNFAFRGGMPMGNLLSGWLVPVFTAPVVLSLNGLLLICWPYTSCWSNGGWLRFDRHQARPPTISNRIAGAKRRCVENRWRFQRTRWRS